MTLLFPLHSYVASHAYDDQRQHNCGPPQTLQNVMPEPRGEITAQILSIQRKDKGGKFFLGTGSG